PMYGSHEGGSTEGSMPAITADAVVSAPSHLVPWEPPVRVVAVSLMSFDPIVSDGKMVPVCAGDERAAPAAPCVERLPVVAQRLVGRRIGLIHAVDEQ